MTIFATVDFLKFVDIFEQVRIEKDIDVDVRINGTLAMANAEADAFVLGDNSVTETLALTETTAVEGVGSESHSVAESLSAATADPKWDITLG